MPVEHFPNCDWRGSAHSMMYHAIPRLVVLVSIRIQAEQVMKNNLVSNSLLRLLHQLLPSGSCPFWVSLLNSSHDEQWCGSVSQIKPLLSEFLWPWCLITAILTLTKVAVNLINVIIFKYRMHAKNFLKCSQEMSYLRFWVSNTFCKTFSNSCLKYILV